MLVSINTLNNLNSIYLKTISEICRICLKKQGVMYSIYDKYSEKYNDSICDMIMYCASVKIEKDDGLPHLLCSTCKARLETAYLFKRDCEASENKLRQTNKTIRINGISYRILNSPLVLLQIIPELEKYVIHRDDGKMDLKEDNICQSQSDTDELQPEENPTKTDTPTTELIKQEPEEEKVVIKKRIPKKPRTKRPSKYYCYDCSITFNRKDSYYDHILSDNHPEEEFVCNLENCNKKFTDWINYSVHLRVGHSVKKCFTCRKCQASFQRKHYLNRHLFTQHSDRPYVCEHCSERFLMAKALERHLNVHTDKYKCKFCDKCFPSESVLESHGRVHHTKDAYSCYECDETFSTQLFLKRHVCKKNRKAEENKKLKRYLCPYCAKRFSRSFILSNHILIHTGAKPFKCDYCEHRCRTKNTLLSHLRTHTNEWPFKCNQCGSRFRQKSQLTRHERYHSGHRPYICATCQKGFTNSQDLKVHERTHTGIKLFSCDICGSSFTTKHYLGVHKKKHEKE